MATLQIRIDESLKKEADALFASLGLDTTTAVRIFLNAAVENAGIPFSVQHRELSPALTAGTGGTCTAPLIQRRKRLPLCWRSRGCIKSYIQAG